MAKAIPPIGLGTDTIHEDSGEVDPLKVVHRSLKWLLGPS